MRALFLCILFAASSVLGAVRTFYIDYGASNDSANGTTTSTPWKRCPGMTGFSGTYTHQNGDRFIFKGGVTWPALTVTPASGGAVATPDYYGVDFAYYTGASWTRPIFNGGGGTSQGFFLNEKNNITIDNIEFTAYGQTSGMIECVYGTINGITIANCYFHNWSGTDNGNCINGYGNTPNSVGVITNCVFDGSPNGTHSMRAVYHWTGAIRNCTVSNMPNAFLPNSGEVSGCDIGPITTSNNGVHENVIEFLGGGECYMFNNVIHDSITGCILGVDSSDTFYVYNNLFYNVNSAMGAIEFDGSVNGTGGGGRFYVYNNTIHCTGGLGIRLLGSVTSSDVRNNHFIDASTDVDTSYNLSQTVAAASAGGYTVGNLFRPTAASSGTVNLGTSIASVTNDLLYVTRPQGAAYDIGAYEYSGETSPPVVVNTNWYVDNALATGTQAGTNWANDWRSLAGVSWSSIQPGDTLYISGGTVSKTYNEILTAGKSGTVGSRITITSGTDSGHNGKVILNAGGVRSYCVNLGSYSYLTLSGGASTNMILTGTTSGGRNGAQALSGTGNGIELAFLNVSNVNNGPYLGGTAEVVHHCIVQNVRGDRGMNFDGAQVYDTVIVSNCAIQLNIDSNGYGPDGIQGGSGITMRDCYVYSATGTVVDDGSGNYQHMDSLQAIGSHITQVGCVVENMGNAVIEGGSVGASWNDYKIYNNVWRGTVQDVPYYMKGFEFSPNSTISMVSNIWFVGNTIVDINHRAVAWFWNGQNPGVRFGTVIVANNIFYRDGRDVPGTVVWVDSSSAAVAANFTMDYNLVNAGGLGATAFSVDGTTYTQAHPRTTAPTFVSYTPFVSAYDYYLASSDLGALNLGTNALPWMPAVDKNGVTRPQGGTWDIGAYEYNGGVTNFYASPTGSSGNTGLTTNSPWTMAYAVDHVGNSNTIIVMDGLYVGGSGFVVTNSYVTIRAQNKWGCIFTNIANIPFDTTANVTHGLVFDGLAFHRNEDVAILLRGGLSNCVIRNCWANRTGVGFTASQSAHGFYIAPGVSNTIENCLAEYCGTNGIAGYNHGIYIAGTNCVVRNNVFRYNGGYGIHMYAASPNQPCDKFHVYNNLSYGNYGDNSGDGVQTIYYDGDSTDAHVTNYFYGNTFIAPAGELHALRVFSKGKAYATNNILLSASDGISIDNGATVAGDYNLATATLSTAGAHDTVTSYVGFVNTNAGLYWLKIDSPARGKALAGICGPTNLFGAAQSSVSDVGFVQYSTNLTADNRTLDPSPIAGADYWTMPTNVPAAIITPPTSKTVLVGTTATFTTVGSGTAPLTYQWHWYGTNVGLATNSSWTTPATVLAHSNSAVYVTIGNLWGSQDSSEVRLYVTNGLPPVIVAQPTNRTALALTTATFGVTATSMGTTNYQWRTNGVNVSGAVSRLWVTPTLTTNWNGRLVSVLISNQYSYTTSSNATLTVTNGVGATVLTNPQSISVSAFSNAVFSVAASGNTPISYQWRFAGTNIGGATAATYIRTNCQPAHAGNYLAVVSNAYGISTSAVAVLTVTNIDAPVITQQPTNQSVLDGDSGTFYVTAIGSFTLHYQWLRNGTNIASANGPQITTPIAAEYSVRITNYWGSVTSYIATLTLTNVPPPQEPTIIAQPQSTTVGVGSDATFQVTATGDGLLSYSWQFNGVANGGTASIYTKSNAQLTDGGSYRVVVLSAYGSVTSSVATLTVTNLGVAPSITVQPQSDSIVVGGSASFRVTATGTDPLAYEWFFNGASLGVTTTRYNILFATTNQAGNYTVVVTNAYGSVTSAVAVLSFTDTPTGPSVSAITPAAQTVLLGANTTFSVTATGSAPLVYEWRANGTRHASSQDTNSWTFKATTSGTASYTVVVTNLYGSITSAPASLTVVVPPSRVRIMH
jgi:hypothetical protein